MPPLSCAALHALRVLAGASRPRKECSALLCECLLGALRPREGSHLQQQAAVAVWERSESSASCRDSQDPVLHPRHSLGFCVQQSPGTAQYRVILL